MKKIVPLSVLSAALVFASVSLLNGKDFFAAKAYSVSSLATTIDLNDCTSDDIRNYYSSINSLSDAEAKGTNLLKNLKTILKNGQKYYSYDSGSLWAMYEISDRDWKKSPASALPSSYGYNASTNIIASYKYGSI